MQIIPTILEKDFNDAEHKIRLVKDKTKWIQIDVTDNIFVPGRTFELELITKTEFDTSKTLWEIHLMVKEPQKWIEKCIFSGASRIIGQTEMMSNQDEFVREAKDKGVEAGLGFDIDSEIKAIPDDTDLVLLMARKAGFTPQNFNPKVIEKISALKQMRQDKDLNFLIGIDGGVNSGNIRQIINAGADIAYCGGAVFNGNVEHNWEQLNHVE